jgi:hypothetical protein
LAMASWSKINRLMLAMIAREPHEGRPKELRFGSLGQLFVNRSGLDGSHGRQFR